AGEEYPQCYTKPLDSLKNWNNCFFWVDEGVFPTAVEWRTNASKDGMPASGTYSVEAAEASGRETAAPEMPPPEEVPLATVPRAGQAVEAVSSQGVAVAEDPGSENASSPIEVLSPG
nr:hypothetical protein [Tanacetum cinerariifolium]